MKSIRCPYCHFLIELANVKPGRFHPACPGCHELFLLVVSKDSREAPEALVMPPDEPLPRKASQASASHSAGTTLTQKHGAFAEPRPGSAAAITVAEPAVSPAPSAAEFATRSALPHPQTVATVAAIDRKAASSEATSATVIASSPHGTRLGGFQLLQKLAQGGMGAVYLARQISLDRNVALKILSPKLAADPQFVSRFTREAFAAAQLTHHNVVQIHDIGVEHRDGSDTNFFAMEYVHGRTLGQLIKETGQLEPEVAVGFVLQAARGLKFAHDHGLIHRDIKPDNLLLSDEGIVKVADLGLVKRLNVSGKEGADETSQTAHHTAKSEHRGASSTGHASASVTEASVTMGTPAFMPPEQARDAGAVDERADIYALGCTLYDLLTGRPPFVGQTVAEVITQHASRPVTPPERLASHVPAELSKIVVKMLAKQPEQRYANMAEVVFALETWLGVESGKPFSAKQEYLRTLELAAERFQGSRWNSVRTWLIRGFFGMLVAGVMLLAIPRFGSATAAVALFDFGLTLTIAYQVIHGIASRGVLIRKMRELVFNSNLFDWFTYFVVAALLGLLLVAFGQEWLWLGLCAAAAGVAALFHFAIDQPLARDRKIPLLQTERLLKELRSQGLDENTIRQFVCKHSGRNWEEFYEQLFGYEAKLFARRAFGNADRTLPRPRHAAWREPIIAWIDNHVRAREESHQQETLAGIEARALRFKGFDATEAQHQGKQNAERLIHKAMDIRHTSEVRLQQTALLAVGASARHSLEKNAAPIPKDWMHDDSTTRLGLGSRRHHSSYVRRRYGSPLDLLCGRLTRFTLALLVLIGFGLWWSNNGGVVVVKHAVDMVGSRQDVTLSAAKKGVLQAVEVQRDYEMANPTRQPLRVRYLPNVLADAVGSWNGAIAGTLLLLSVFFAGRVMAMGVGLAAAVALFGRDLPVPILPEHAWAPVAAAVALWFLSIVFLRQTVDS